MRGVFYLGDGRLEIRDLPKPTPGPGEVVIAIKASGLCGSEQRTYRSPVEVQGDPADLKVRGHEPCGVVAEAGANVNGVKVGDRVMMHHHSGCRSCKMCRIGYTQMCLVGHQVYGRDQHGAHADFLLAPDYTCVALPEQLGFDEGAALACGTGTAFHALKRLALSGTDTIAIFGQGPVGLSATLFAATMGAKVLAVDVVPERLELSRQLGAEEAIDARDADPVEVVAEMTHGLGADAALEATGIPQVRKQALDGAMPWGRVCFVGEGGDTSFDVSAQIIRRQLTIYGSWTFGIAGLAEVADFVAERRIPLRDLITHRFPLEEAGEAHSAFESGKTGKVVLVGD